MSAGYSATPLLKKLGIRAGMKVAFVDAPGEDLSGNDVRHIGLAGGLVDVKVCAVDEDWSGLKFVRRLEDRT